MITDTYSSRVLSHVYNCLLSCKYVIINCHILFHFASSRRSLLHRLLARGKEYFKLKFKLDCIVCRGQDRNGSFAHTCILIQTFHEHIITTICSSPPRHGRKNKFLYTHARGLVWWNVDGWKHSRLQWTTRDCLLVFLLSSFEQVYLGLTSLSSFFLRLS